MNPRLITSAFADKNSDSETEVDVGVSSQGNADQVEADEEDNNLPLDGDSQLSETVSNKDRTIVDSLLSEGDKEFNAKDDEKVLSNDYEIINAEPHKQ